MLPALQVILLTLAQLSIYLAYSFVLRMHTRPVPSNYVVFLKKNTSPILLT